MQCLYCAFEYLCSAYILFIWVPYAVPIMYLHITKFLWLCESIIADQYLLEPLGWIKVWQVLSCYPSILLFFNSSILLSFYPHILLSIYPSIIISFYPFNLLFFYSFILLSLYPSILLTFYSSILLSFYHYILLSF